MVKKQYKIEVIEEPYMNNSLPLKINGKPYKFSQNYSRTFVLGDLCNASFDYLEEIETDFYVYRSQKNPSILYVVSDAAERWLADNHKSTPTLREFSEIIDEPVSYKGFKTATYGRKGHRDGITQLENSVRRMF